MEFEDYYSFLVKATSTSAIIITLNPTLSEGLILNELFLFVCISAFIISCETSQSACKLAYLLIS